MENGIWRALPGRGLAEGRGACDCGVGTWELGARFRGPRKDHPAARSGQGLQHLLRAQQTSRAAPTNSIFSSSGIQPKQEVEESRVTTGTGHGLCSSGVPGTRQGLAGSPSENAHLDARGPEPQLCLRVGEGAAGTARPQPGSPRVPWVSADRQTTACGQLWRL